MQKDLTSQRFGRLTVVALVKVNNHSRWLCKCDCGNETIVTTGHLTSGDTRSCGCLLLEHRHLTHKTHGDSKERLYRIWADIKTRCYNKQSHNYHKYGQRGIKMCNEWYENYEAFRDWAMANGYAADLTIDRINFNGNYCPENCRWVSQKVQQNNRRNNHIITYGGETLTVSQWNEKLGFSRGLLSQRLNKLGWDVAKAITTPINTNMGRSI